MMKTIKKLVHQPPGMPFVAAIFAAAAALVFRNPGESFGAGTLFLLYTLSYIFYRFGGVLDNPIFTPLYGTDEDKAKRLWLWKHGTPFLLFPIRKIIDHAGPTHRLDRARISASSAFGSTSPQGLYSAAKDLFEGSPAWEKEVKPVLSLSKAARALVLPLILVAFLGAIGTGDVLILHSQNASTTELLKTLFNPWVASLLAITATSFFLYFRVWHMVALYELVVPDKTFFFYCDTFRVETGPIERHVVTGPRLFLTSSGQVMDVTNTMICAPALVSKNKSRTT